jgi:hypothetical protein
VLSEEATHTNFIVNTISNISIYFEGKVKLIYLNSQSFSGQPYILAGNAYPPCGQSDNLPNSGKKYN